MDDLRVRLIERVCRLPQKHLTALDDFLGTLERGSDDQLVRNSTPSDVRLSPPASPLTPHKDWPHTPIHRLSEHGTFIVTASTVHKEHFFRGNERLTMLEDQLLRIAKQHDLVLEAWAVFSNHYHFVAHTSGAGENQLKSFLTRLHYVTAEEVNRCDDSTGRQAWFNYWDTRLTFEKPYFARLSYVHQNAVKHGLVRRANEYRWCSAAWFERTATPAQLKTI
jgi:putative transposase